MNKDLILREKLAIQRTHLANQTTLLSYLRTALYFLVAGLSIDQFFTSKYVLVSIFIFVGAGVLALFGGINFFYHRRKIYHNEKNVGDYKLEYLNDED